MLGEASDSAGPRSNRSVARQAKTAVACSQESSKHSKKGQRSSWSSFFSPMFKNQCYTFCRSSRRPRLGSWRWKKFASRDCSDVTSCVAATSCQHHLKLGLKIQVRLAKIILCLWHLWQFLGLETPWKGIQGDLLRLRGKWGFPLSPSDFLHVCVPHQIPPSLFWMSWLILPVVSSQFCASK